VFARLLCLLLLSAGLAQAQNAYRCTVDGRTVLSDRPCTSNANSTSPVAARGGAAREASARDDAARQQASAQCGELKRILRNKQERAASLSEGERGDLERSKAIYHERCGPL
jgi:hypothetical protein